MPPAYFDYIADAREASISDDQLKVIERSFRADYPNDGMLFELHVLRVCLSVKAGRTDLGAVLREMQSEEASAA